MDEVLSIGCRFFNALVAKLEISATNSDLSFEARLFRCDEIIWIRRVVFLQTPRCNNFITLANSPPGFFVRKKRAHKKNPRLGLLTRLFNGAFNNNFGI